MTDTPPFTNIIETVRVPGGSFYLGRCAQQDPNGGEPRTVESFHIGRFPVTQGQWYQVMGTWPSYFDGTNYHTGTTPVEPVYNRNNLPVEHVNWYEALVFANTLSMLDGFLPVYMISGSTDPYYWGDVPTTNNTTWNNVQELPLADGWRLPTYVEWEFAAKGGSGSSGTYFIFSGSNTVGDVAWYRHNWDAGDMSLRRTHPVTTLAPNALGLHHMSGNVWEWVYDWFTPNSVRVVRGGSWYSIEGYARSAFQGNHAPYARTNNRGFRLVRP